MGQTKINLASFKNLRGLVNHTCNLYAYYLIKVIVPVKA